MKIDIIRKRRSVRTFDDKGLSENELNQINQIIENLENPFNLEISFVLLEKDKYNLDCPVLVGEKYYICALTNKKEEFRLALGYVFEDLVLKLEEIDLCTTIIAGTYKKDSFIEALKLNDNQELALITPVGHKADKMSIRETLMRKGIKADERENINELFFKDDFDNPLDEIDESLQAIRLAPSAVNKQPWRILENDEGIHFYVHFSQGYEKVQMIDMGIALRNFMYVNTRKGNIRFEKPDIKTKYQYVVSYYFD